MKSGITATCANLLVQQGLLDLDAPVAHYWPEFARAGKQHMPVRWLLTHQAGLPHLTHPISLDEALDWYPMIEALVAQPPLWPPGRGHGYHAQTFGWLVGEVIRRITGHTPGRFFNTHIAEPFGLDLWIGLPEQHRHRFAPIIEPLTGTTEAAPSPIAVTDPPIDPNDPRVHAAEIPSSNAIGTAQSLAHLYATLISDDQPILTADTLASATTEQVNGQDRILNRLTRYGIGYSLPSTTFPLYGPRSFGHGGKGGSLGLADPDYHIAFGYLMNQMHPPYTTDIRTANLTRALRESL
jgi:CubicO group peptidase (beta-lactamase class C family)